MYLTNIKALVRQLKSNTVSEHDKLSYLLVILIFSGLSRLSNLYDAVTKSGMYKEVLDATWSKQFIMLSVSQTATILMFIVAAFLCYYVNKKGDNKNFLERFICLLVPASIINFFYALLILFAVFIPLLLVTHMTGNSTFMEQYRGSVSLLIQLGLILNFWRLMYTNMKEVASK